MINNKVPYTRSRKRIRIKNNKEISNWKLKVKNGNIENNKKRKKYIK